jgi:hypothetical protein
MFANEERARTARKTSVVEWGGLQLWFSKYVPNFDSNAQGAEILLSKSIKIQFPNLHDQFKNENVLRINVGKIGEVLDIEEVDSYTKGQPAQWSRWKSKIPPNSQDTYEFHQWRREPPQKTLSHKKSYIQVCRTNAGGAENLATSPEPALSTNQRSWKGTQQTANPSPRTKGWQRGQAPSLPFDRTQTNQKKL